MWRSGIVKSGSVKMYCKFSLFAAAAWGMCAAPTARADRLILVSSRDSNSILEFDLDGVKAPKTLVASGAGGLSQPVGMRVGPDGNLYVASFGNNKILRYNVRTGASLGTFASGPNLMNPADLRFGPDGDLYVANFGGTTIARFNGTTGAAKADFVDASGPLANPNSILFGSDGTAYVSSFGDDTIYRFNSSGAPIGLPITGASLTGPAGLSFGSDGSLYAASLLGESVEKINVATGAVAPFANTGTQSFPADVLFTPDGRLLVTSLSYNAVLAFSAATGTARPAFATTGLTLPAQLLYFNTLVGDGSGDCTVGAGDYAIWAAQFGRTGPNIASDYDTNGSIGAADYALWAANFGATCPPETTAVPEPASWRMCVLAALGCGAAGRVARSRKRKNRVE